jgi:hypothetical protein
MVEKRYLVSCKTPEVSTQSVVAATCEVRGEHLPTSRMTGTTTKGPGFAPLGSAFRSMSPATD